MKSFLGVILAMMVSIPIASWAQQPQAPLQRVHLMTGAGTLPRNPANRLEYLRYATTGEPRLTGKDLIERIPEVPRTLSNKKLEVPVKKILLGAAPESAASRDSLANPEALDWVADFAVRAS